jgi:hypothetical protein
MKKLVFSLIVAGLSAATPLIAANSVEAPSRMVSRQAGDPAAQVRELARLARINDLGGLVRASVPPGLYDQMRAAYELHRHEPVSEHDGAEFAEGLGRFSAPDAVDQLMAEIEPKLVEARPKAPAAIMMGLGALQMAVLSEDNRLTAEQRASLQQMIPGLQRWANGTDFLSSIAMRQALTLVSDAVRSTGVRSLDDLRALSFEQVLGKAEPLFAAGKQALLVYGLDVDAIVDTMQVEVVSIDGSRARVRTTITVFDAPIAAEHELVLIGDRWYGKHAVDHWSMHIDREHRG